MLRGICLPAILLFSIAMSSGAVAQSAINDVHLGPRGRTELASAGYSTDSDGQLAPGSLIRTSVDLVLVPVTITDDHYRPVVGLDQGNFQLFENKKPQPIKHFSNEDAPVSVGILVDTSGSMSYKLERAGEAVSQFCDAANPQDEFFLITFADAPQLTTDFTNNAGEIKSDLLTARSKGQTSLLDAIYMGIRKMRTAQYARKALLILSDGGDNHSRYSERDVKAAIKESDVAVYAVGTYESYVNTREELLGPELLRTVAELSGGRAFNLSSINDAPDVTRAIGTQLRHQYMLAYQPQSPAHDGKWHRISVKLRLPRHLPFFLHVDARPGYYARAQ